MARLLRWKLNQIVEMIILILLNRYDAVICNDGLRGVGKSTFGIVIARRVSAVFSRLKRFDEETVMKYWEKVNKQLYPTFEDFIKKLWELKKENAYSYKIRRDTLYTRDKIIKFFDSWHKIAVGDELVMSCFNRDFYSEEQKDLIKIINTNRDHSNLLIGCVPSFNTLDTQIKGLMKLRFTIIRRGIALIHTPNKTMFGKDRWDSSYNEKIERKFLEKKSNKIPYTKFTTVRGLVTFRDLPPSLKKIYEEVKKDERNVIAKEQFGLDDDGKVKLKPHEEIANRMIEHGVKNGSVIEGYALANNIQIKTLIASISRELKRLGKDSRLSEYYWDDRSKKGIKAYKSFKADKDSAKEGKLSKLIHAIITK